MVSLSSLMKSQRLPVPPSDLGLAGSLRRGPRLLSGLIASLYLPVSAYAAARVRPEPESGSPSRRKRAQQVAPSSSNRRSARAAERQPALTQSQKRAKHGEAIIRFIVLSDGRLIESAWSITGQAVPPALALYPSAASVRPIRTQLGAPSSRASGSRFL
jgi:hypothetical protein